MKYCNPPPPSSLTVLFAYVRSGRRWYLGIQSKKESKHVMRDVYGALKAANCSWHILTPYRVVVTPMSPASTQYVRTSSLKSAIWCYLPAYIQSSQCARVEESNGSVAMVEGGNMDVDRSSAFISDVAEELHAPYEPKQVAPPLRVRAVLALYRLSSSSLVLDFQHVQVCAVHDINNKIRYSI